MVGANIYLPESELVMILWFSLVSVFISPAAVMTSVQFEGTKIEDSYLTLMRNCILGGDNFRAFRVDLGGQNSKGDNFLLFTNRYLDFILFLPCVFKFFPLFQNEKFIKKNPVTHQSSSEGKESLNLLRKWKLKKWKIIKLVIKTV